MGWSVTQAAARSPSSPSTGTQPKNPCLGTTRAGKQLRGGGNMVELVPADTSSCLLQSCEFSFTEGLAWQCPGAARPCVPVAVLQPAPSPGDTPQGCAAPSRPSSGQTAGLTPRGLPEKGDCFSKINIK